ncbi:MAG: ChaN family lipoprotein [Magnetococcales bacterium]|nr:ChaN family lipoprotein [Magnetococcales bacterium]
MGPQQIESGQIVNLFRHKTITQEQFYDQLNKRQVVLVGETHDNVHHHKVQLKIIKALHKRHKNIVIGLEMFPRHLQPILDRWVADELTRKDFLEAVDWDNIWGFDANLYMEILRFARDNQVPLLAMNIKREIVKEVRLKGVDGVDESIRHKLPKIAPASREYTLILKDVFDSHPMMSKLGDFKNFVQAQQVWDGVMATQISEWLGHNPYGLVIGLTGSGHISYGHGIPHQLKSQGIDNIATVLPWNIDQDWPDQTIAYYAWGVPKPPPPPVRFGIFLEDIDQEVYIKSVMEGSLAAKHGLKPEDEITHLNGQKITSSKRLVWLTKRLEWGTTAILDIVREGEEIKIELDLER